MNDFLDMLKRIATAIGEVIINVASAAAIAIDGSYRAMDGLRQLASRYDWFLTPSVHLYVIMGLATEAVSGNATQHTIYRHLRDYLRENGWAELSRIVADMREYSIMTKQRHKIVRDAAAALGLHGDGGFNAANLIVPALFALIDGMLNEFAREVGIPKWANRRAKGPERLRAAFVQVTYGFDEPALDLIFKVLFSESYVRGKRKLNRHRVLHGEWLCYGSVEHVLRAFLMLDFLGYVIEEHRRRRLAGDMSFPITYRSQLSRLFSENFVKDVAPLARERLASIQRQASLPPAPLAQEQSRAITQWAREMEPLYEVTVDGRDPVTVTASALMEAWRDSAPEGVARAFDLPVESQLSILQASAVVVRRLR